MLDAGCSLLDSGFLILDGGPFGLGAKRFAVMAQAALRKRRVGIGLSCRVTICDFAFVFGTQSTESGGKQQAAASLQFYASSSTAEAKP